MKTNTSPKNELWIWIALHFSFLIAIPVIFSTMSSCIKQPELKSADLGQEVQMEKVTAAIGEALQNSNPYLIREGQAVHYVDNYRVETSEIVDFQESIQQVVQLIDNEQEFTAIVNTDIYELQKNKPPVKRETVESELQFHPRPADTFSEMSFKAQAAVNLSNRFLKTQNFGEIRPEIYALAGKTDFIPYADRQYIKSSLHNLKVTQFVTDPPPAVRARENCGDVPNCKIKVTQLNFDEALWYSEAEFDKVIHEYQISTDVPYMGQIMNTCNVVQQFIEDRDYVVRRCRSLYDFIY